MRITWEIGEKHLDPVEFKLREVIKRRWWWFDKVEYWIETEFARVGPIADKDEAMNYLAIAQRS